MGKQATKKLKRRQLDQKRGDARRRALAAMNDHLGNLSRQAEAHYEAANPADRKALEAFVAEIVDETGGNPYRLAQGLATARQVFAAPLTKDQQAASPTPPGQFPNVESTVRNALLKIRNDVPNACPHLTPDSTLGMVCVDEADTIMCPDCFSHHCATAHTPEWDRTCTECGSVDLRGISVANTMPVLGVAITFGNEVHRFLSPVMICGLGLCNPCRLAAGRKRKLAGA